VAQDSIPVDTFEPVCALSSSRAIVATPVPSGQPWVLSGPSVLLADVIHGIATAATDSYAAAWRNFTASPDSRNGDWLRIALDTVAATTATAIALARVQNDAP
jgi:hypothetical protein